MSKLDTLAFGAHPDDVELGCGATIRKHADAGKTIGIIDLTRGELGTRGTPEIRAEEATVAASILGVEVRDNLNLGDGFFVNDKVTQTAIIKVLRKYQPEVVLCNACNDRHPDHGRAADLVSQACFLAGLRMIETTIGGESQERWRPKAVYHYIQDHYHKPDFVVDVTDQFETKMEAVLSFKSQFYDPNSSEPESPISSPEFMEYVRSRSRDFGRIIGCGYGEGFTVERSVGITDLFHLL